MHDKKRPNDGATREDRRSDMQIVQFDNSQLAAYTCLYMGGSRVGAGAEDPTF